MIVNVRMIAFMDPPLIRQVQIPDDTPPEGVLDRTFHFGQNDFQPIPNICSVSVGDVIEYAGKLHMVAPMGFREITEDEYKEVLALPRRDRSLHLFGS